MLAQPIDWQLVSNNYTHPTQPWAVLWEYPNWTPGMVNVTHDCEEEFAHYCTPQGPTPAPPWSDPFDTIYSGNWTWEVGVAGSILGLTKRTWEFRYEREQGAENWREGSSGPICGRTVLNQKNFEIQYTDDELEEAPGGGN